MCVKERTGFEEKLGETEAQTVTSRQSDWT